MARAESHEPALEPLVTVVVPTYRRADLLPRLVAALESQTLSSDLFEVLIIDDCSPDDTPEVLAALAAKSPIDLRLLRLEDNGGQARARNIGWRSARAPLVAFTDDDCVPHPDWLAQGIASARATPDLGVLQGATLRPHGEYPYGVNTVYRETLTPSPYFEGCNLMFPRAVLERIGGFDETRRFSGHGEDTAAGWAAVEDGGRWLFDEMCVVTHDIEERPFRWHLTRAWREGNLVDLAVQHPAVRRDGFWRPWAHRPWNVAIAVALLGTVAGLRWRPALLAWLPWLCLRGLPWTSGPRVMVTATARFALNDVVVLAGMLRASARNRTLIV